ncbi:glycosyltransferase [Christiangramia salexigens]|uniref:Glycosyltransferase 2-like domain-containing protein n=1 Tax=Christiangramia salexigens TaxID=1913577 RepID=A0A1L3J4P6_9FLAO|nr:glycosyltransferase [Christiangramia salexigens]APG60108.1 hypothetical protein LPB144_06620 [Christiangramia salexigens]
MRKGFNPEKDRLLESTDYTHQVIIPVYIPHLKGYHQDSLRILRTSLDSLINSVHDNTFISVVNNGSCNEVRKDLENYFYKRQIQELVHTDNIGKLNGILKAIAGYDFPLITIADSDVFFCSNWQAETYKVFEAFPRAGTVGLVPQFNMFSNYCTNTIFDNFFNKSLKFYKIEQPKEMWRFYKSLGWEVKKDHYYFDSILGIKRGNTMACIGSGHFVATYRKELFTQIERYLPYKLGGTSEKYLDKAALKCGLWKLTTFNNFAYHMGNSWEDWMGLSSNNAVCKTQNFEPYFKNCRNTWFSYFIKNKIFKKFLRIKIINKLFLYYMKLPADLIKKYPRVYY